MGANEQVRKFVDAYRGAFESFDAAAITGFFHFPFQVTSDAGEISVVTVPTVESWLPQIERLVGAYQAIGIRSADVVTLEAFELTPTLAQANITWRLLDGDGESVYEFDAAYTLADPGAGLRITAIAHNETPRLRAALARAHART